MLLHDSINILTKFKSLLMRFFIQYDYQNQQSAVSTSDWISDNVAMFHVNRHRLWRISWSALHSDLSGQVCFLSVAQLFTLQPQSWLSGCQWCGLVSSGSGMS